MATVSYFSASIVNGSPPGLLPGQIAALRAGPISDGDVIQIGAHPGGAGHVRGDNSNDPLQPCLAVENIRIDWQPAPLGSPHNTPGTRYVFFDVKNAGASYVTDYLIAGSIINR